MLKLKAGTASDMEVRRRTLTRMLAVPAESGPSLSR